jgi:hypothetical protein
MDASKLMSLMKAKKQSLKQKEKTIKPAPGANRYVLLPGWRKEESHIWVHDFGQHYIKNAAGEIQAVYPCLDKTFGNACPICEGINKAARMTTDDETVKLLKEAGSGQSYLFNVLALDADDDATPQILEVRKTAFAAIVDLIEEWGAGMFDPEAPQIIVVNREGKGLLTKYTVQISPKKHTLPKGVLTKLNNLDDYVRQENEDQQRRALNAINSVAGLLPIVASGADKPMTSGETFDADQESALRTAAETRNGREASKAKASDIALDDELSDLLGDLAVM